MKWKQTENQFFDNPNSKPAVLSILIDDRSCPFLEIIAISTDMLLYQTLSENNFSQSPDYNDTRSPRFGLLRSGKHKAGSTLPSQFLAILKDYGAIDENTLQSINQLFEEKERVAQGILEFMQTARASSTRFGSKIEETVKLLIHGVPGVEEELHARIFNQLKIRQSRLKDVYFSTKQFSVGRDKLESLPTKETPKILEVLPPVLVAEIQPPIIPIEPIKVKPRVSLYLIEEILIDALKAKGVDELAKLIEYDLTRSPLHGLMPVIHYVISETDHIEKAIFLLKKQTFDQIQMRADKGNNVFHAIINSNNIEMCEPLCACLYEKFKKQNKLEQLAAMLVAENDDKITPMTLAKQNRTSESGALIFKFIEKFHLKLLDQLDTSIKLVKPSMKEKRKDYVKFLTNILTNLPEPKYKLFSLLSFNKVEGLLRPGLETLIDLINDDSITNAATFKKTLEDKEGPFGKYLANTRLVNYAEVIFDTWSMDEEQPKEECKTTLSQ